MTQEIPIGTVDKDDDAMVARLRTHLATDTRFEWGVKSPDYEIRVRKHGSSQEHDTTVETLRFGGEYIEPAEDVAGYLRTHMERYPGFSLDSDGEYVLLLTKPEVQEDFLSKMPQYIHL